LVNYPVLTDIQQDELPALTKPAQTMSAKFEDSTHQLWHCETVKGSKILKVCNHDNIKGSSFWQGMNNLFDARFPDSLGHIEQIYRLLSEHSPLTIPKPSAYQSSVFVLSDYLLGQEVDASTITDEMVKPLAEHIAALHQAQQNKWGAIHHGSFYAQDWSPRLYATLVSLLEAQSFDLSNNIITQILEQAKQISVSQFVPVMMDLRWDQFLHQQGQLSAVVDLDAFVYAPQELELVMLEYLLTSDQCKLFIDNYIRYLPLATIDTVRQPYRLLLFLMNMLGETDLDLWLNAPIRF